MAMIQEGQPAPDFTLQDQAGKTWKLSELRGKHVVVYFYPKDDTPGCTVEACGFRDLYKDLEDAGAVVLGLSPDDTHSHQKFANKYQLPFTLLADEGHKTAEAYGAWGEKNNYGKKYMGILRSTFLVGPDGNVKTVWPKVSPEGHNAEVLAAIRGEPAPQKPKKAAGAKAKGASGAEAGKTAGTKAKKTPATSARTAAKPAVAQKAPAKKAPGKGAPAKRSPAKSPPAKKAPGKGAPAKRSPAKKPPAKKAPGKKAPAKRAR